MRRLVIYIRFSWDSALATAIYSPDCPRRLFCEGWLLLTRKGHFAGSGRKTCYWSGRQPNLMMRVVVRLFSSGRSHTSATISWNLLEWKSLKNLDLGWFRADIGRRGSVPTCSLGPVSSWGKQPRGLLNEIFQRNNGPKHWSFSTAHQWMRKTHQNSPWDWKYHNPPLLSTKDINDLSIPSSWQYDRYWLHLYQ